MPPTTRASQGPSRALRPSARGLRHTCALLLVVWSFAAAEPLSEGNAKAAFVFNFAKFTDWPSEAFAGPGTGISLCLLRGVDSYEVNLGAFAGKSVQGRPFAVHPSTRPETLRQCQMLFLDELDERHLGDVLKGTHGLPVLTVSDIEGFAESGGMIGLVHIDNRIQFEVNPDAVTQGGLKVSAQLMQLARIVKTPRGRI
jgi:YfiR/HmsC-like